MAQLYSRFGLPIKLVGKHQLPIRGCHLVRAALVANGETDGQGRPLVSPKHDGEILHADDKIAQGWIHDADLRAQGGWPTIEPMLKDVPEVPLDEKSAREICAYLGYLYEHEKAS